MERLAESSDLRIWASEPPEASAGALRKAGRGDPVTKADRARIRTEIAERRAELKAETADTRAASEMDHAVDGFFRQC